MVDSSDVNEFEDSLLDEVWDSVGKSEVSEVDSGDDIRETKKQKRKPRKKKQ